MIELKNDRLVFRFPELDEHLSRITGEVIDKLTDRLCNEDRVGAANMAKRKRPDQKSDIDRLARNITPATIRQELKKKARYAITPAEVSIDFQRTLRIPDDGREHFLPPGLGGFPLRHTDDFSERVPSVWSERGGVLMPMYQAEALWLNFSGRYPCALQVGSGKIDAVTGDAWSDELGRNPQNYLVTPEQPWLDGFAIERGVIRQFVATPLGGGGSVEEQITGAGEIGGIQLQARPLKASRYFDEFIAPKLPRNLSEVILELLPEEILRDMCLFSPRSVCEEADMGLGMGGKMKQEIYTDPRGVDAWSQDEPSRCFVHLCNSSVWKTITGTEPPHPPVTSEDYNKAGLPWFDYYRDDLASVEGSEKLGKLKSLGSMGKLPAEPEVIQCGPDRRPDEVREW